MRAAPVTILVLSAVLLTGCSNREPRQVTEPRPTVTAMATTDAQGVQEAVVVGDQKFHFTPSVIRAHPGKLRLVLRTSGGTPHNLRVDVSGVESDLVSAGGEGSVTVILPRAGTYPFECTLHDKLGMTGKIVVS